MKLLHLIIFTGLLSTNVFTQGIEEEIGFKLVKAEYLFGTERFEDAIKELNEVIKVNPTFKNALLLRAETKYKLAAYKGAKEDALKYIEMNGITTECAAILGKSEYALNNQEAALNSLSAAIALSTKDVKVYEMRAEIYTTKNQMIRACNDWEEAAKLGSTTGAINAKKCGYTSEPRKKRDDTNIPSTQKEDSSTDHTMPSDDGSMKEGEIISEGEKETEKGQENTPRDSSATNPSDNVGNYDDSVIHQDNSNIPEEDDTENKFVIDEDLSITVYGQGLGKRKILDKPSILILSEENGVVAVEICVNENGNVDYAEFNTQKSTLTKKSLVSLSIRKAKEFWFEKSDYPKQCGFILFHIKAS